MFLFWWRSRLGDQSRPVWMVGPVPRASVIEWCTGVVKVCKYTCVKCQLGESRGVPPGKFHLLRSFLVQSWHEIITYSQRASYTLKFMTIRLVRQLPHLLLRICPCTAFTWLTDLTLMCTRAIPLIDMNWINFIHPLSPFITPLYKFEWVLQVQQSLFCSNQPW